MSVVSITFCILYLVSFVIFILNMKKKLNFNNPFKVLKLLMLLNYLTIIVVIMYWSVIFAQTIMFLFFGSLIIIAISGLGKSKKQQKSIKIHILSCFIFFMILLLILSILGIE